MTSKDAEGPQRREIEELLPWHAAGTLSSAEAARIEAALREDPELARQFELAREELAGVAHVNEALGSPSPRALDALFARIDAEPVRGPAARRTFGAAVTEFFMTLSPRVVAWSAAAAALVIAIQAVVIGAALVRQPAPSTYQVASGPGGPAASTGAFALVRFAPAASAADVTALLQANDAQIVDGPKPGGLYRIRLAATVMPADKLAEAVRRLQKDKAVDFVAPSQ